MHRNAAAKKNIKLISTSLKGMPVPDICADFEISEGGEQILQHSVGYKPLRRKYSSASNQVKTYFPNDSCSQCPHFEHCHPKLRKYSGLIVLSHSAIGCANQQRLITAEDFQHWRRVRNGVEAVLSILHNCYYVDEMPVRGKILNCLKADYARIFKSDVIVDLIKVMGCGVELGGKHNKELATFNLDNLRYNKIVICTDADVDGYQIRTLVLTMLYRLTPTLINEGYVYIAESPLYEINTKDHTYFAYTEPEKATFLKEIGDKKYTIQRSKGLGENDPEMMWLTTMNPESRRLIKVQPADVEETARVFDLLLGDNLAGRKEHIAEHGAEYLDDLDVS